MLFSFSCFLIVENCALYAFLPSCLPRVLDVDFSICNNYRISYADFQCINHARFMWTKTEGCIHMCRNACTLTCVFVCMHTCEHVSFMRMCAWVVEKFVGVWTTLGKRHQHHLRSRNISVRLAVGWTAQVQFQASQDFSLLHWSPSNLLSIEYKGFFPQLYVSSFTSSCSGTWCCC
jgi:hypothetical protein